MEAALAVADRGDGRRPQRIEAAAPAAADEGGRDGRRHASRRNTIGGITVAQTLPCEPSSSRASTNSASVSDFFLVRSLYPALFYELMSRE